MTDFLSLAAEGGFSHCAPLCMAAAVPRREVRGMCAADRCGKWGRCWSLPARLRHAGAGGIADCAL